MKSCIRSQTGLDGQTQAQQNKEQKEVKRNNGKG